MAIKKTITASNGVATEYHRVALVIIDVNQQNTILVHSYLSDTGRQVEKDYAAGKYNNMDIGLVPFPYTDAEYIHAPYDGEMTVSIAYDYLKTLEKFEGAEDC